MARSIDDRGTRLLSAGDVPVLVGDLPAKPSSVRAMRRAVRTFAAANGASGQLLDDIARSVSEAVGNVVMHAYEPGEPGEVHVRADVADDALEVVVSDDGRGLRLGESPGMGLGLGMIAASAADFRISEREPHGTQVWMRFLLPR
jgi:anti-sigma regulatory factor (Ser/Thr protein kinase)